jgi:hypothetical protein
MADLSSLQGTVMAVFDTATLTGTYAALNGSGFSDNVKVMKIYNASNVGVTVSYNGGADDQDFFPAGATQILDVQANHQDHSAYGSGTLNIRKGQILLGKGSAGVGNLYIIGYR